MQQSDFWHPSGCWRADKHHDIYFWGESNDDFISTRSDADYNNDHPPDDDVNLQHFDNNHVSAFEWADVRRTGERILRVRHGTMRRRYLLLFSESVWHLFQPWGSFLLDLPGCSLQRLTVSAARMEIQMTQSRAHPQLT